MSISHVHYTQHGGMLLIIHPLPSLQQQSRMLTWRTLWMILPHFLLLVRIPVYIYIYTLRNCYSIYNLWLVITLFRSGDYCHVVNLHCDFVAPKPWSTAEVVVLYHDKQITCEACGTNSWFSVLCAQAEELFIILKTTLSLILQSFGGSLRGVRWEAVSDCWGPGEDGVPGTGSASVCVPSRSAALILNAHTRKAKGNVKEWRSLEAAELQPRYEGLRTTVG